jgi:hypothetical protein
LEDNMRTAIFVYESTQIDIHTCESDLMLCALGATTVALSSGTTTTTLARGMYRIDSCHDVNVHPKGEGDAAAIEVVVAEIKTGGPDLPTVRANEAFAPLDSQAVTAFFAVPDAKVAVNP